MLLRFALFALLFIATPAFANPCEDIRQGHLRCRQNDTVCSQRHYQMCVSDRRCTYQMTGCHLSTIQPESVDRFFDNVSGTLDKIWTLFVILSCAAAAWVIYIMMPESKPTPEVAKNNNDGMRPEDGDTLAKEFGCTLDGYGFFLYRILHENNLWRDGDGMEAIRRFHQRFMAMLPGYARNPKPSLFTTSLHSVINIENYLKAALDTFSEEKDGKPLFSYTAYDLKKNLITSNGYDFATFESVKNPKLNVSLKVFENTPILSPLNTQIPVHIPTKDFASHSVIIAPPRWGKTQLLGSFLKRFHDEGVGVVLLDPHGDLFNIAKTRMDPKRLIIFDPDVDPPPLNFLDFGKSTQAQALQAFKYLMSALSGGLSDKQSGIVPYIFALLQKIPDATMETLRLIVDEKVKKADQSHFWPKIQQLPVIDQGFFQNQFYTQSMQVTKDAIGWKLYAALQSEAFRKMFGSTTTVLDADAILRDRKILLVKGARRTLGDDGMHVFLQFIVSQFYTAALRRDEIPEKDRHLTVLLVDEMKHVLSPQIENILTECRKYGVGWMGATQLIEQIPREIKAAMYGATAIKIVGKVQASDAMMIAREMDTTAEHVRGLEAVERSHSEWALHVLGNSDFGSKAATVTLKYGQLEAMPEHPQNEKAATSDSPPSDPRLVIPDPLGNISPSKPTAPYKTGDRVQVMVGGYDWFPNGALVMRVKADQGGFAFVDPTIFAEEGDPEHCHKEYVSAVPFSDLAPYKPATKPPHPAPGGTPKNQNTRDPHTDYDTDH